MPNLPVTAVPTPIRVAIDSVMSAFTQCLMAEIDKLSGAEKLTVETASVAMEARLLRILAWIQREESAAAGAEDVSRQVALLLNRLILASTAKGYQQASPHPTPDDERITDAYLEKLEGQILAALRDGGICPWQPIERYRGDDYVLLLSSAHGRVIGGHVTGDVWHLVGVGAVTSPSERPTHWMPLPDFPVGPLQTPRRIATP